MKKSKAILVAVLAVILCVMCATTTTFSWFTRPLSKNGLSFKWSNTSATNAVAYNISNGSGVTMNTYESTDDGETYSETPVTSFNVASTSALAKGERKYYRTDITNNSSGAQNVSLFISNLTLPSGVSDAFHLGTNGPLKTYKQYNAANALVEGSVVDDVNLKNVYVGFNINQTYVPINYQVHYWGGAASGDAPVSAYMAGKTGNYLSSTYNMSYSTIDWNATSVRLHQGASWYGSDNTSVDTNNTICHYYYDNAYKASYVNSGTAAGIESYYSSANISVGKTMKLTATGQGTISYSTSDFQIATVASDGTVTAKKEGTVTIMAISTGEYGDKIEVPCQITVFKDTGSTITDVPITTNYEINKGTTESIYWYIKNDASSSSISLNYNIADVYLTL